MGIREGTLSVPGETWDVQGPFSFQPLKAERSGTGVE